MNFYVYMWLRKDGSPYYVGKGHGKRAFDRTRPFRPRSVDRVHIIEDNLTESSAFELEKKLIAQYGRKDLGTGILHNQTDGGEGSGGARFIRSEEYCTKMSAVKKATMTAKTKEKIRRGLTGKTKSTAHVLSMKRTWESGEHRLTKRTRAWNKSIGRAIETYWNAAPRLQCPYCSKVVVERFYYRYHGENCAKKKPS